jgi:tRNA(adenine34) deaminase
MDPKSGCAGSVVNLIKPGLFNHNIEVEQGVLEKECGQILSDFFKGKRKKK